MRSTIELQRGTAAGHSFQNKVAGRERVRLIECAHQDVLSRPVTNPWNGLELRPSRDAIEGQRAVDHRSCQRAEGAGAGRGDTGLFKGRVGELRCGWKQPGEAVGRLDCRAPSRSNASGDRRRRGHRDLLAQDCPHGDFKWLPGARRANARVGSEALLQGSSSDNCSAIRRIRRDANIRRTRSRSVQRPRVAQLEVENQRRTIRCRRHADRAVWPSIEMFAGSGLRPPLKHPEWRARPGIQSPPQS